MEDESGNEKRFNDTKDNEILLGADMKLLAKFRQKTKIPNNNISIFPSMFRIFTSAITIISHKLR